MIKKILSLIILLPLALAGAASGASEPEGTALYADLVQDGTGRYTITEISNTKLKFDLSSLKPVGYDISKWDCSTALYGRYLLGGKECVPPDNNEFRTSRKLLGPTLKLGLTSLGFSFLVGIVKREGVFDYEGFNMAVSEALVRTGIDDNRASYIKRYARLHEKAESHNAEIKQIFRKHSDPYFQLKPLTVLRKELVDASGLYRKDDLFADVLIKTKARSLTDLIPEDYAPPSFSSSPENVDKELSRLEAKMDFELSDRKEKFIEKLKKATGEFDVICEPDYVQPYHLRYECPSSVPVESRKEFEAKAHIVSKDLKHLFPRTYTVENDGLKVIFTKNWITLENLTGKKLRLRAITTSYNDKAYTFYPARNFIDDVLEPGVSTNTLIQLRMILNSDLEKASEFKDMTIEKVKDIKVNFGIKIDYSLEERKGVEFIREDNSLSGTREFVYEELI